MHTITRLPFIKVELNIQLAHMLKNKAMGWVPNAQQQRWDHTLISILLQGSLWPSVLTNWLWNPDTEEVSPISSEPHTSSIWAIHARLCAPPVLHLIWPVPFRNYGRKQTDWFFPLLLMLISILLSRESYEYIFSCQEILQESADASRWQKRFCAESVLDSASSAGFTRQSELSQDDQDEFSVQMSSSKWARICQSTWALQRFTICR